MTSISTLSYKPTVRVVFQVEDSNPSYYTPYLQKLKPYAYIMGEILDSEAMKKLTKAQFQSRVDKYIGTLNPYVDIWEIGNEINGSWLGDSDMRAENVGYAYDAVKAVGKPAALTTWYDPPSCVNKNFEMISWNKKYIPQRVRDGVDYALISYYGSSCVEYDNQVASPPHNWDDFVHLNNSQWTNVFNQLKTVYPNSKVGFGEIGYQNDDTDFEGPGNKLMSDAEKIKLIKEYHGLDIKVDKYIGGYFYWEGSQDLVPNTNPIWKGFNEALDIQAGLNGDSTATTTPTPTPANQPPSITLYTSNNGAALTAPGSVTVSAQAADTDGTVSKVELFQGSQSIKVSQTSPYQITVSNLAAGTYAFKAVVTDNSGATTTSNTITVTVNAATTPAPTPNPTVDTQAPTQPGPLKTSLNLNWTKLNYELAVSWTPSTDNVGVKDYYVSRNGKPYAPIGSTSTTFVDDKLEPSASYAYQVWAVDTSGNPSTKSSASVTTACFWYFCWVY